MMVGIRFPTWYSLQRLIQISRAVLPHLSLIGQNIISRWMSVKLTLGYSV
jgi:hypothetical protein